VETFECEECGGVFECGVVEGGLKVGVISPYQGLHRVVEASVKSSWSGKKEPALCDQCFRRILAAVRWEAKRCKQ
jgi:hypothetical protein